MPKPELESLYCSFCRKPARDVAKLIGGPGVYICDGCVAICNDILEGNAAPAFDPLSKLDEDELIRRIGPAAASAGDVEENVREHVRELRRRNVSWGRIGAALGVSRQAAWERFAPSVED